MSASEEVQRIGGLVPGREAVASVVGDIDEARKIARQCLDVVSRFSEAIIRGAFDEAFALCASELRMATTLDRFADQLRRQDEEWDGKPIEYEPERVVWIYASEAARRRSNKDHDWPKATPKPNKRALVNGWWTTEKPPGSRPIGRPLTFWVSEEEDGYRISRFQPYRA